MQGAFNKKKESSLTYMVLKIFGEENFKLFSSNLPNIVRSSDVVAVSDGETYEYGGIGGDRWRNR
jgi:hypothetical protein